MVAPIRPGYSLRVPRPSRRRHVAPVVTVVHGDGPRTHHGWLWVALLAAVLVFKIALALTLAGHPLLQPEGELDAGEYWRLAQRVAGGDVLLTGTPFHVSPLYIYWLAAAQAVTGARVTGVLVLQALLGTLAVWVVARTARMWVPDDLRTRASLVAGGALALTGIVALQEALILQSALDALLMALAAFTFTRALQAPSFARWAWCGAALALMATNRPERVAAGASVSCRGAAGGGRAGTARPYLHQTAGPTLTRQPGPTRQRGCAPWGRGYSARRSSSRRSRSARRSRQVSGRCCPGTAA